MPHELVRNTRVTVDNVTAAVYDSGEKSSTGEAVVFVHGNPGPMDDWADLAPAAAQFARVIAIDLPGFGQADHPRHFDFSIRGYARYLAGALDQLGAKKVHLVLHDFGGPWGLRWALDHPQNIASISLINTGLMRGYKWHTLARIWQTPILGELFQLMTTADRMHAALNKTNPVPVPRSFVDRVMKYADWPHKRTVLKLYRNSRFIAASFADILTKGPPLQNLPACVIWGAADIYLPVKFAEQQKEFFLRAEVHILEGLGHWPFIDNPQRVQEVLVPFLQRQVEGSRAPG